ncbi:DUF6985 domain-containing protein [Capnocytophaga cynodegmi]|uniref:DUF6985 domain-containing protein n=1 Tax=Capnocytophaga cynodegmi TaxID=28189 RepID=UPI001AC7EC9E|nr:hypothetical protein [Capnocytophaga cynodegmi]GIM54882.1 hypothetical protein CAPN005_15290 [Capnocytophaga cynodegmi]
MNETLKILEQIDKEMSKMLGKSRNKMTNEEFRAFVSEKWQEMNDEKYQIHDAYILIGRMMNEAIWANDPKDLVKWMKEDQKHQSSQKNTIDVVYNFYTGHFIDCKAFAEGLAFFQNEEKSKPEAKSFVELFQNILDNPEVMATYLQDEDNFDDFKVKTITLEKWQSFFCEEEAEIGYEILTKIGNITERETKKHKNGLDFLKNNQMQVLEAILSELLKQYPEMQNRYRYSEADKADFMPNITNIKGFTELLSPTFIYVFSEYQEDIPYIGISFHCMWEQEHGLGVLICKDRVVQISSADIADDICSVKDDIKAQKKK